MDAIKIISGKKLLIVDDEKDVRETLFDILSDYCLIDMASSFDEAKSKLKKNSYHVAVLDIMGVDGYELLKIANDEKIPALMLTAHALSPEKLIHSIDEGAKYYAPKEKMVDIALYIADILESIENEKSTVGKMIDRLGGYFSEKFHGTDWEDKKMKLLEENTKKKIQD